MVDLQRQRVTWNGFPGGPGISTFYFIDAAAHQTALHAFLVSQAANIPPSVTLRIEADGDTIDAATGALVGSWTGIGSTDVLGTGAGPYAGPSGYQVKWLTGLIVNGHRVSGRTYFVPASHGMHDNDGTLNNAYVVPIQSAANTFIAAIANNLRVWSRPRVASPTWTDKHGKVHAAVTAAVGAAPPVSSASVPDVTVVLTSRRD